MVFQQQLKILISCDEIAKAVSRLAREIERDYQDRQPLLIAVLKGSFMFMADLIRQLDLPLDLDFIRLSSYDAARESSGKVEVVHEMKILWILGLRSLSYLISSRLSNQLH